MKPTPLTQRIENWFAANPSEELTYSDMAAKFGIPAVRARSAVKDIRRRKGSVHAVHVVRFGANQ